MNLRKDSYIHTRGCQAVPGSGPLLPSGRPAAHSRFYGSKTVNAVFLRHTCLLSHEARGRCKSLITAEDEMKKTMAGIDEDTLWTMHNRTEAPSPCQA